VASYLPLKETTMKVSIKHKNSPTTKLSSSKLPSITLEVCLVMDKVRFKTLHHL
jgi:hypothetical protein